MVTDTLAHNDPVYWSTPTIPKVVQENPWAPAEV